MWHRLTSFLRAPVVDDPESSARARLLHAALMATVVGVVPIAILNFDLGAVGFSVALISISLLSLICVGMNHRGHTLAAAGVLTGMVYFATIYTIIDGAGLYDTGILALPIVITLSTFFYGQVGAVLSLVVSIGTLAGLGLAGANGWIGGALAQPLPKAQLTVTAILLLALGALISVIFGMWQRNLSALRDSRSRLELAINSAGMGVWESSGSTGQSTIRDEPAETQGLPGQDASAYADWVDRLHPDDREAAQASLRQYLADATLDGPAWLAEYRVRRSDGAYRWRLVAGRVAEKDGHGHPVRMTGMFMDITDNKEAQMALLESERRYRLLTQELHDSATQTIYSMTLTLKAAQTLLEKDPSRIPGLLGELDDLAKNALIQMRTMLSQARPDVLESRGLVAAIQDHIAALEERSDTKVAFQTSGRMPLPMGIELALYRVTQEALNNVLKHAGDTRVNVDLQMGPGTVRLLIQDHGRGFDPIQASRRSDAYGLATMRERIEFSGRKV